MTEILLLDVDNTLLDFDKCAEQVICHCFSSVGLMYDETVFPIFLSVNNGLWRQVEQGTLTRNELYAVRWNQIFQRLGIAFDGPSFERIFSEGLFESHIPVDGAISLLQYLHEKYTVCIASNAMLKQQKRRLELAGMLPYIDHYFTSHEIGYPKPTIPFFRHCLDAFPGIPKDHFFLIGDSLTADIQGAVAAGIPNCWYNPAGLIPPENVTPDYTVNTLSAIQEIL